MASTQVVPVAVADSIVSRRVSGICTCSTSGVADSIVSRSINGISTGNTSGCGGQHCH